MSDTSATQTEDRYAGMTTTSGVNAEEGSTPVDAEETTFAVKDDPEPEEDGGEEPDNEEPEDDGGDEPDGDASQETGEKDGGDAPKNEGKDADGEDDDDDPDVETYESDPKGVRERINKITKFRREAEREAARMREENERIKSELEELRKGGGTGETTKTDEDAGDGADNGQAPDIGEPPHEEDFDTYEDFIDARAEYKARKIVAEERAAFDKKLDDIQAKQQEEKQQAEMTAKQKALMENGTAKYKDFEDVALNEDVPYSPVMIEAVVESDSGADLAYHFGQNPDVADEISRMSPVQAARAIGRIEATLTADRDGAQAADDGETKTTKKTTKATPPFKGVKGGTRTTVKDPQKMSQKEYEAWRKDGGGK